MENEWNVLVRAGIKEAMQKSCSCAHKEPEHTNKCDAIQLEVGQLVVNPEYLAEKGRWSKERKLREE